MSIGSQLPSLDFRNLVSENEKAIAVIEKDFETHHTLLATSISYSFAKQFLKSIEEDFKKPYFKTPSESKPGQYYMDFHFDQPKFIENTFSLKLSDDKTDFANWELQFSKGLKLNANSNLYAKELMERVAELAERKFIEYFKDYTSNPKHSMFKFSTETLKEDYPRLKVNYWIDKGPQSLVGKKGVNITEIKKAPVKEIKKTQEEEFFGDWKDF